MQKRLYSFFACAVAASFILANSPRGLAQDQKLKLQGIVAGRSGEDLTLRTDSGDKKVTLIDGTKVGSVKAPLKLRRGHEGAAALVPGLRVEVEGHDNGQGQVIADDIKFTGDDLKTAYAIQSGLAPTDQKLEATGKQVEANTQDIVDNKQQIQSNQQQIMANGQQIQSTQKQVEGVEADTAALGKRFDDLSDYDVKGETTVYFGINSASLSDKAKSDLSDLAASASNVKGYLIQVAGYADSSGSAAWNEQLSDRRAQAVVNYLRQECNVQLSRVLAPAPMGVSQPAASNDTAKGRQENRRVEVKILVNRGMSEGYTSTAALQ
ncbi:MAG TPA: OmpA family protein [Terriglobia bacterium]|nr:OmpA family protein [Terriglobia bacterium]